MLLRQAAKRFLEDLKRAGKRGAPFHFSREHANHACGWIELLPHVEGKWEKAEIVLHPAQLFFVVQLFGFRKADGTRRFTSALYATARKSGKSTLAAGILLYCQCCEDEPGAQVISAATTLPRKAQARAAASGRCNPKNGVQPTKTPQAMPRATRCGASEIRVSRSRR